MAAHSAKILSVTQDTHDVRCFRVSKPAGYKYSPGQATDVAIDHPDWRDKPHAFTFTSLNSDPYLEFIIKGYPVVKYPHHSGMTEKLHTLSPGDGLILDDPWGTISYRGPGVFIAGGAGVTPFIAIFRQQQIENNLAQSRLIYSNKTAADIILESNLHSWFSADRLVLTLTRQAAPGYLHGRIDSDFLKRHVPDFSVNFYLCGPKSLVSELRSSLTARGISSSSLIFEE